MSCLIMTFSNIHNPLFIWKSLYIEIMSGIKTLLLNSLPTDYDFEDYISAQLLLGGYTLDRSIHEKVAGEIFEVEVITHQYNNIGFVSLEGDMKPPVSCTAVENVI